MTAKRLRASAICEAEGHLLLVRMRDPVSGVEALFPPGGGIEPGETPPETARRETLEETGLRVRVDADVKLVVTYPFRWADVDYEVTTHYFAASLEDAFDLTLPKVIDADYNLGASWLPVNEALEGTAMPPVIGSAVARIVARVHSGTILNPDRRCIRHAIAQRSPRPEHQDESAMTQPYPTSPNDPSQPQPPPVHQPGPQPIHPPIPEEPIHAPIPEQPNTPER